MIYNRFRGNFFFLYFRKKKYPLIPLGRKGVKISQVQWLTVIVSATQKVAIGRIKV
jgi:hypothetical protein